MRTTTAMAAAALLIGFSKTALGGLAVISVAIFATVLPARQSTGAILVLLIVGDLVACTAYRRHADWRLIGRLLPAVLPGLVLGWAFLRVVDDTLLRRTIGAVLLVLVVLQLWVRTRAEVSATAHERPLAAFGAGTGAGFATMTANAAGAVMALYLSAAGIEKRRFVGTNAWFFLIVNLVKVPFSVSLGLIGRPDVVRAGWLAPVIVLGGWLGWHAVGRISQRRFDTAVLLASAVAALALLVR